jgi:hypothetical protein
MQDAERRRAAAHAIDKQLIIDRLLSGYGVPIDTLQTPEYEAYDASIAVPYDEARRSSSSPPRASRRQPGALHRSRPREASSPRTTR